LWRKGQVETRRLADETGVAKSTLSSILNELERRKLVRRRAHETGTPAGSRRSHVGRRRLISALSPKIRVEEARIVAHLPSVQRKATVDTVRVILATIAQLEAPDET
jgi:MarR family transcriptional regulator, organic hydroperoxide resistance regulator